MSNGLEIERKFLIAYPDTALLDSLRDCSKVEIEQTYLSDRSRVRKWCENGKTVYIKTVKEKISEITRIETEGEIEKAEYERLLLLRDESRVTIKKTRYRYPYLGKIVEIDLFPFWSDRAFLEVELNNEDEEFSIPPFIEVIREVTEDKRYRNSALAKEIPYDEI